MKKENPNFSPKLSRRELFKLGGVTLGSILLSGCNVAPRARTPEPTKTPTPEPLKLTEIIKVAIPELAVEKYAVEFPEITKEVPESYRKDLKEWIAQPGPFSLRESNATWKGPWWSIDQPHSLPVRQCDLSLLAWGEIIPDHGALYFYFDGQSRFYSLGIPGGDSLDKISDEDRRILGWQKDALVGYTSIFNLDLSRDGKILYNVHSLKDFKDRGATILADIPKRTKTVIRESWLHDITPELSDNGNKIALSFTYDANFIYKGNPKRGIYLIDLDSWQVRFQLDRSSDTIFLNEDGSLLYVYRGCGGHSEPTGYPCIGYIYNTLTGKEKLVEWPNYLMTKDGLVQVFNPHGEHFASPNLRFIARKLGMFPTAGEIAREEIGEWGISVHTPEWHFIISSPEKSFPPEKVDSDGTIYTTRGDIFKFENGTYRLAKIGDRKPIEVSVQRLNR